MRLLRILAAALMVAAPLQARSPAQGAVTAFTHANVVPMDGERVLLDQTVVVRDGTIAAIGRDLPPPAGATVIDARGKWLSPGLADMHVHSDTRDDLAMYLSYGVTTVTNMGEARSGFMARTVPAAIAGRIPGPHVYAAFLVDGSPEYAHFAVTTPAEARAAVGLAKTNGYHFMKAYNNLAPEVFAALAAEGRRLGVPIVGHSVNRVGLREQIARGQVLVAHAEEFFYSFFAEPGEPQTDAAPPRSRIGEAVAFARQHRTAVGADLVTYAAIMRQIGNPDVVRGILAHPAIAEVAPADRLEWQRSPYVAKTAQLAERNAFLEAMLTAMADADVELLSGTDAPTIAGVAPGAALHDNLAALESAGLTRYQALASATRNPGRFIARTLGGQPFGTVAAGMRADLLLTAANPLDGLVTLRRPLGVMTHGRWHDAATLAALREAVKANYAIGR